MNKPYSHLQICAGGGARFAYYLGSYAALCDLNRTPQAIVGVCGGALAAYFIHLNLNPHFIKKLLVSPAFYQAVLAYQSNPPKNRFSFIIHAIKRAWTFRQHNGFHAIHQQDSLNSLFQELNDLAIFHVKNQEYWLRPLMEFAQTLPQSSEPKPDVMWVASEFFQNNQSQSLKTRPIWFIPAHLANTMNAMSLHNAIYPHAPQRIDSKIKIVSEFEPLLAVYASMTDMYYQKPIQNQENSFLMGGVLDLLPIEIATALSENIYSEEKPPYHQWLALPAIARVFGIHAEQRRQEVIQFSRQNPNIFNLPFADNRAQLRGFYAQKRWDYSGGIHLDFGTHAHFANGLMKQWDFGYTRTMNYFNL